MLNDCFVYYNCVNGHCPVLIESIKYGITSSSCEDYCGAGYSGCEHCYFEGSDMCNECIHSEQEENVDL